MGRFEGKVALVTGGGSGIGRASCVMFAREGAKVAVADWNAEGAQETARMIKEQGEQAIAVAGDVSKSPDVQRMVDQTVAAFGGHIDILFNNAGIAPRGTVVDMPEEDWDHVMAVDVKSIFLCCKYVIPIMQRNGGGAIVNTGSMCSLHGYANLAAYTAAKGAVLMLTKQLAADYKPSNIRVNCVCPGFVYTPLTEKVWRDQGKDPAQQDLSKLQMPEEIAEGVLFFASDAARQISGDYMVISGNHPL